MRDLQVGASCVEVQVQRHVTDSDGAEIALVVCLWSGSHLSSLLSEGSGDDFGWGDSAGLLVLGVC